MLKDIFMRISLFSLIEIDYSRRATRGNDTVYEHAAALVTSVRNQLVHDDVHAEQGILRRRRPSVTRRAQRMHGARTLHALSEQPVRLPRPVMSWSYAWTTTIFPPASFASMTRCASRISSKRKTRLALASSLPAAASAAIACRGTSESGKPGGPNTKLAKKGR